MAGRFVLHLDLDEFIAAVERLRHPELEGRPIVVGGDGDPTKRGVVSTASYEARAFGIRSAMPLRTAYKRNPDAVFLPVDEHAYLEASRRVMQTLRSFGAPVEVAGWDEAFMVVETGDPEDLAREIQRRVLERTRLWSTIGIGDNRLQAKLASGRLDLSIQPSGVMPNFPAETLFKDSWVCAVWSGNKNVSDPMTLEEWSALPHACFAFGRTGIVLIDLLLGPLAEMRTRQVLSESFLTLPLILPNTRLMAMLPARIGALFSRAPPRKATSCAST